MNMKFVGTWATEMEIQAASDLIGVDVFTYSQEKWLKYSSSNVSHNRHSCEQNGIYLKHINSCHYEVVVCVKTKDGNCASFCKSPFQSSVFYPSSITSSDPRKLYKQKFKYNSNHDLKQEKIMKSKNRYYKDERYKESINQCSNAKYKTNEQFKEKVKKFSINKYKSNSVHCEAVKKI